MWLLSRFLVAIAFLALPGTVLAHAIGAEAKLKEGRVHVEGYFDDDSPAASAKVWVENESKDRVAEGQADARGQWSFPAPAPGRYRITVDAGAGHRAVIGITIPPLAPSTSPAPNAAIPAPAEGATVSEGPTRAEFTRIPWFGIILGLILIAVLALGVPRLRRLFRPAPTTQEVP